ncbi:MAG: NAD(P)H-dependent oxidoreductase [Methanobacteriaceae archaeon]|nr:NAD(P)H-dependent oxidoreductase [Methanobacteriaceae archaeon]
MVMRILVIMGSPRKGNSYKLTQLIEKRLKDKEGIDLNIFFSKKRHWPDALAATSV